MNSEMTPRSGTVDPTVIDPTILDEAVYQLTKKGREVADAIANGTPFNYACADLSMRNLVGLMNGVGGYTEDVHTALPETIRKVLTDLATDSLRFVYGDEGKAALEQSLEIFAPSTPAAAEISILRYSFNELQSRVSIGPVEVDEGWGYHAGKEAELRDLVSRYGHAFSSTFQAMHGNGVPQTSDPFAYRYFESNIAAATPRPPENPDNF